MSGVLFNRSPSADTYWHVNPDRPGQVTLQKVFDREPVLDHCAHMRNEVVQAGELRKVMSVPIPLIYQWMREGKLGEEAFFNGVCIVDPKKLQQLFREYDGLRCVDRL